jgi:hypothetical protein
MSGWVARPSHSVYVLLWVVRRLCDTLELIRPYTDGDLADVLDVWYLASLEAHSFLSDEFFDAERQQIAEQWLPTSETSVFEMDGCVVGSVSMSGNEVGGIFRCTPVSELRRWTCPLGPGVENFAGDVNVKSYVDLLVETFRLDVDIACRGQSLVLPTGYAMESPMSISVFARSELDWPTAIGDRLDDFGWIWHDTYRTRRTPGRWTPEHSAKGVSDLICLRPRRVLWLEIKTETGRVTPQQEACIEELRQAGG